MADFYSMDKTESKKTRLIAAARKLMHANGYAKTTLAEIAGVADVPLGNVYYYFKTKDTLAQAVIHEMRQEFTQLIVDLDRLADPRARIDGYLSMRVLESESIADHGCALGGICSELNKEDTALASQANALMHLQIDWLARQFAQMGKPEEAPELATQLMATLQGASLLSQVSSDASLYTRQIAHIKVWLDDIA